MKKRSAIILAGGKNTRMGINKAFLKVNQTKIIDYQVDTLRSLCDEVIIVTNKPEDFEYLGVSLIEDLIKDRGPLSGIYSGLSVATSPYALVMACDMPYLDRKLIEFMFKECSGYDAVVPVSNRHLQPLHAIYSKNCLKPIIASVENLTLKVSSFYNQVSVRYISETEIKNFVNPERAFFNINTPDDLRLYLQRFSN